MSPALRNRVIAEWRGYREPVSLAARVHPVRDVLSAALKGLGLGSRVLETEVISAWKETVGEFIAQHSRPARLRDGVLYVSVLQPAIHFELEREWKAQIIQKLRARFGAKTVREVRFRVG